MDGTVVSLPEVVVEGQYADTYSFRRTIVKDFTESFEEEPTVADLRAAAVSYVSQSNIGVPEINLKVSFEHLAQYSGYENLQLLEKLNLGDTVRIFYEPLNVSATARIAKTTFDCLNEKYNSVQIGSVRSDLEQIMHTVSTNAAQMKQALQQNIPSALAEAVENATDLITGANGGYVVLDRDANGKPFQILIMDTDDKATATNVLRLNQNGIGFSTSGYSGPFSTAWTIDSNFVADFITAGTLNVALAKIGVLADAAGKNSWNMQTGAFTITNGSINIQTDSSTSDIIRLTHSSNSLFDTVMQPSGFRASITPQGQVTTERETAVEADGVTVGYCIYQIPGDSSVYFAPRTRLANGRLFFSTFDTNTSPPTEIYKMDLNGNTMSLYDNAGTLRHQLDGGGRLWQYDANGKKRTYLEYGDIFLYTASETRTLKLSGAAFPALGGSLQLYDTSAVERTRLTAEGLNFYNSSGTRTGNYPNNVNLSELVYLQTYDFNGISISAGTSGTRAAQRSVSVYKSGYRPIVTRLSYVSDSSLANVVPFFGGGDESGMYVNFYRASGAIRGKSFYRRL